LIKSVDDKAGRRVSEPGELGELLFEAYAVLDRALQDALVASGYADIRPAHAPAFRAASLPTATVTSMAAATGVTKQHMSQLVAELERFGYLRRSPGADARTKVVHLTERGVDAVRVAADATAAVEAAWLERLGARGMTALVSALRRCIATHPSP
jgi:DNA-binding MarR family transcriptional regulator